MVYMVVVHFRNQDARAIYDRFNTKGRMVPVGMAFHGS